MSRELYELTDETRRVLSHNPQAIAEEMGKHHSFIYDFLEMRKTDIFAQFLPLYNATIRAGAPFCHWDNRFAASRHRYLRLFTGKTLIECLTEKITTDAATTRELVDALQDGKTNEAERRRIRMAIAKERENLEVLEITLNLQD